MSVNSMDEILSRWFRDGQFREQLRTDPEQALAGFDLTPAQQTRLFKLKKRSEESENKKADFPFFNSDNPFSLN